MSKVKENFGRGLHSDPRQTLHFWQLCTLKVDSILASSRTIYAPPIGNLLIFAKTHPNSCRACHFVCANIRCMGQHSTARVAPGCSAHSQASLCCRWCASMWFGRAAVVEALRLNLRQIKLRNRNSRRRWPAFLACDNERKSRVRGLRHRASATRGARRPISLCGFVAVELTTFFNLHSLKNGWSCKIHF